MQSLTLILLVFAATVGLVAYLMAPTEAEAAIRVRARQLRDTNVAPDGPASLEDLEMRAPFLKRLLGPGLMRVHKALLRRTPQGTREALRSRLREAGDPLDLGSYLTSRLLAAAGAVLLFALAIRPAILAQGWSWPLVISLGLGVAYAGSSLPSFWLSRVITSRQKAIERTLPEVLDLLFVSIEAGLGLDGAIQKVAERQSGPFAEELNTFLKEVGLGKTREQAWRGLAERVNLPDLSLVVAAIIQAEKLGVSLAQVLRIQSADMRDRRRQRAEERARQVPIKLLFPMVFFIFPAVFIVILGPAIIQLARALR